MRINFFPSNFLTEKILECIKLEKTGFSVVELLNSLIYTTLFKKYMHYLIFFII